jgi:hypothetical protein
MTTSGTYAYDPSLGELVLYAFNVAQLRSPALTQAHFASARTATNLMLASWANKGVNLWKVDLVTVPLIAGQASYTVDPSTVVILDAYVTLVEGNMPIDRPILPISRTEYSSYPNKTMEGSPTVFWFDRLLAPTVTIWPVPNGTTATSMSYYRMRQIQDANLPGGQTVDIPYLWLEAFADGLAFRLAKMWMPAAAPALKMVADESYTVAAEQNIEVAQVYFSPQIGGYFRP